MLCGTMSEFDRVKDSYRATVDRCVGFVGKDVDFFAAVKADFLGDAVRREFGHTERLRVLDVGCGHGIIHPHLRRYGFDLVGADTATEVLDIARAENPGIRYVGFDGKVLPFEARSFDVAYAVCVMHHVPPADWIGFLAEMRRVVRPGGMIAVFEHNPWNPLTRYVVASNEIDKDAVLLAAPRLRRLLERAGFTQVRSANILFTPFLHPLFRRLDMMLWWCPLGAQYFAVGRS